MFSEACVILSTGVGGGGYDVTHPTEHKVTFNFERFNSHAE